MRERRKIVEKADCVTCRSPRRSSLEKVVEAIRFESVTSVPGSPSIVRGKVPYEEEVVFVIEVYTETGLEYPDDETELQIVIVD